MCNGGGGRLVLGVELLERHAQLTERIVTPLERVLILVPCVENQSHREQVAKGHAREGEVLVPHGVERLSNHLAAVLRLAQLHHDVRVGRAALVGRQQPDAALQVHLQRPALRPTLHNLKLTQTGRGRGGAGARRARRARG